MRLWSLHPKYLDTRGLVALWREGLLAQAVLKGKTRGYRYHPQLDRFRRQTSPTAAVAAYLQAVYEEAVARGHSFDVSRIGGTFGGQESIPVSNGQLAYEWRHLMAKLHDRAPELQQKWQTEDQPEPHPLFLPREGGVEPWERPGPADAPV